MLSTVLDLLGLLSLAAACIVLGAVAFGPLGIVGALAAVGLVSLSASWVIDQLARARERQ